MELTEQQKKIINTIKAEEGNYLINSYAGTSKSTISERLLNELPGKGLYVVFGKANQLDMQNRIKNANVDVYTIHKLALVSNLDIRTPNYSKKETFTNINFYYFKNRIEGKYNEREKNKIAEGAIKLYREFCTKKEIKVEKYNIKDVRKESKELVKKVLTSFISVDNREIIPLDILPKILLFYIEKTRFNITKYDYIIVDEIGDLTEVDIEIFRKLKARRKIYLGDKYQNIFEFRGTTDAFEILSKESKQLELNQSFRVPKEIAKLINEYGQYYLSHEFNFEGYENPKQNGLKARLFRTNVSLFKELILLNDEELKKVRLLKKPEKMIYPVIQMCELILKPLTTSYKDYPSDKKEFMKHIIDKYRKVKYKPDFIEWIKEESEELYLSEFKFYENILKHMTLIQIKETYKKLKEYVEEEENEDIIIYSTIHMSKGLTFSEVYVDDDIEYFLYDNLDKGKKFEFRLYYVAVTRTSNKLTGYLLPLIKEQEAYVNMLLMRYNNEYRKEALEW